MIALVASLFEKMEINIRNEGWDKRMIFSHACVNILLASETTFLLRNISMKSKTRKKRSSGFTHIRKQGPTKRIEK
jgi:hypothetical protein